MEGLTRSELAHRSGVGSETLRYYEQLGLLDPPPRTRSGHRRYPESAVRRLVSIKRAQSLGFTLTEVKGLAELRPDDPATQGAVVHALEAKIEEIDARVLSMQRARAVLANLAFRFAQPAHARDCRLFESLACMEGWAA